MCVVLFLSTAYPQDGGTAEGKWRLSAEIGKLAFPSFIDMFGLAKWNQRYTMRTGIGKELNSFLWGDILVEYRRYNSQLRYGEINPWILDRSYLRHEVAVYACVTVLEFVQVGLGTIYQSHEEIFYSSSLYPSSTVQRQPAQSRVKLFYLLGIQYSIPVIAQFYVPVGLSIDTFLGEHAILSPTFRLGISKRL